MAGVSTSEISNIIVAAPREEQQQLIDTVFKYSDLWALLPKLGTFGGSGYEIPHIVAGNDSAQVFVEDQAVPDAGYQQTIVVTAAYKSLRVFTRLTGHARRQAGATWDSTAAPFLVGGQIIEAEMALQDLLSLWETTFLGSSKAIYNLYGILDDSTTAYYDTSRSSYATLACYVKTAGAAMTTAILDAALAAMYDATYGGRCELMLMSPTQARKYSQLVHGKTTLVSRGDMAGGSAWAPEPYAGIEILTIRGMPNSMVWMLSKVDQSLGWANHEPAPGGVDILPYGVQEDAKITQYVMSGAVIVKNIRQQGAIETLGTT